MKDKDILIVDDSQVVRNSIELVLKNAGFKNLHYAGAARAQLPSSSKIEQKLQTLPAS